MSATWCEPPPPSVNKAAATHDSTPQRLRVIVAFDEDHCASQAEVPIHRVGPDESCETALCHLKQLATLPQVNEVAFSASETDLFIIAIRCGNTLAQPVQTLLSPLLTLRDDDQEGVSVILLSGANVQPGANIELRPYLETLAVLIWLELFAIRAEMKAASDAGVVPLKVAKFAEFAATIHAPVSLCGWGINEQKHRP